MVSPLTQRHIRMEAELGQPVGPQEPDLDLLSRIAALYYLEDMTQQEIAENLGLSRPKVGRLLQQARDEKIVEITVHAAPRTSLRLEETLRSLFPLDQAVLAPDYPDRDPLRTAVAAAAGAYMTRQLVHESTVAVGMGRNVGSVPEQVPTQVIGNRVTFISAIGGSTHVDEPTNSNDICRRLALKLDGYSESLYAPAYAETVTEHDALMRHHDVRATLERAAQAGMAIVGVGDAGAQSAVVSMGCVSVSEMRGLRREGAVGDILGSFFDIEGRALAQGMKDRVVSLERSELEHIPCVVAVVSERTKVRAVVGALRTGIVNVLVTSTDIAQDVLAFATSKHTPSVRR